MKKQLTMLFASILLTGCGVFNDHQQTYYVKPDPERETPLKETTLLVQVVPSVETTHIPLFYYSRKWVGPYTVKFSTFAKNNECVRFRVQSFTFRSEGKVVEDKHFRTPLMLDTCKSEVVGLQKRTSYQHKIDESFEFVEGRKVELEVKYQHPNKEGVQTLIMRGKGEERDNKSSLFEFYLSV